MMRSFGLLASSLGLVLSGCSPNLDGEGSEGGADDATSSSTEEVTGATAAVDSTNGSEAGSGSGSNPSSATDSGEPACEDPDTMVLWAADGEVIPEMSLEPNTLLGGVEWARSWSTGELILTFDLACDGPLYLWGLVFDRFGGDEDNPDSFFFAVDDDTEAIWSYGCETPDEEEFVWQWSPIEIWSESECDHDPFVVDRSAGPHLISIRNREVGMAANVAGIAAVVISHDPDTDPLEFLDPDAIGE